MADGLCTRHWLQWCFALGSLSIGFSAFAAMTPREVATFPEIIHQKAAERQTSEADSQKTILDTDPESVDLPLERGVVHLLQGIYFVQSGQSRLAARSLEAALRYLPKETKLYPVAEMYLIEAKIPQTKPLVSLQQLKTLVQKSPTLAEWRPEQYALMLDVLMTAKSDSVLYKTWGEYESKVRPAQRSDAVAQKLATFLESHIKRPSKELIAVLESMAAFYPYNITSRWAFQKLQSLSCHTISVKQRYVPSTWFLSRLAANSVLDPGLRSYVVETIKGPVRTASGEHKILEASEQITFLMQARLINDAQQLAENEVSEIPPAVSPATVLRRAKALFQSGQLQLRQSDWASAARTFSQYIAEFSEKFENKAAYEAYADSLVRLRLHKEAAEIYGRLAASPASDPVIRWHHFWNTYLSRDYQQALEILDRPGYVPTRDQGVEGGYEYWRGRILEKLGKKALAEESFKKIFTTYGDSYYAILLQATRPALREASLSAPPQFHDGGRDIKEELGGREGFAAKVLDNMSPHPNSTEILTGERTDLSVSRLLQKWGQYKFAKRLVRTISWSRVLSNNMFSEMTELTFSLGDYGYGLKAAALPDSPLKRIPSSMTDLHSHMAKFNKEWRLMYPLAHERLALAYADAAGIDHKLLLSIMRAESVYDPDARSSVGAQGLMQMMPFTAIRIARLMGDHEFMMTDLHVPEVNIGYGAYYLRKLIDYYEGNMLLAVAAYNAGPAYVDRWVAAFDNLEVDEFVEMIAFKETRKYVKTVLRNYNQYRNVYSDKPAMTSLPPMPAKRVQTELF